jgi:hypothetical protein
VKAEPLTPERAAARVCELGPDARAAVLLHGDGGLAGSSDDDPERSTAIAGLAGELLEAIDGAAPGEPPEAIEAQVEGGAIYAVRRGDWTLAAVARRTALSSLMIYDLRAILTELEAAA